MFPQILTLCLLMNYIQPYLFSKENEANELISQGRVQYQLLKERGTLPRYGSCWKSALETVDHGCRELSEESQSDIALALTNCFLDMSGLETHHCEMDKKLNLKRICVSSMTDKAFNVYTEFYTHTMNMCWFLRGQIWQETITDNTLRVGRQLETSAERQELLLEIQKESFNIQSRMLEHSKDIESVLAELNLATQNHREILLVLGGAINDLQSWLIGEVSWINSVVFYLLSGFFFIIATSMKQTVNSRLPILTLLVVNMCVERAFCSFILSRNNFQLDANQMYGYLYSYVCFIRYGFWILCLSLLFYRAYFYEDPILKNKTILNEILKQNHIILENLKEQKKLIPDRAYLVYKSDCKYDIDVHKKSMDNISSPDHTEVSSRSFDCIGENIVQDRKRLNVFSNKYNLRRQRSTPPIS